MENHYSNNLFLQNIRNVKPIISRDPNLYVIDPNVIPDNKINKIKTSSKKSENRKPENRKPESNKPENRKPESNKPENRKPETRKTSSKKTSIINFEPKSKKNLFIDMYNYRNKLLESKLSLLPKKFDYVEQDNEYQEAMMLLNKENEIKMDDINKIKFISFSEFKSKLLLSKINEDLSLNFFFSKNKDFLYKIINKLYFNKNVGKYKHDSDLKKNKLSPIIEERTRTRRKHGGSGMLEDVGEKFLSILSVLDRKHDFKEAVGADITKYIDNEGVKYITSKFPSAPPQLAEILELFSSNKDYEESILINTINHVMGTIPHQPYLSNANKLTSFAFIDVDDTMNKLQISYKSTNTQNSEINGINTTNIFNKLITYIAEFFNYDMTTSPTDNYKFIFDTDIKVHSKIKTATGKQKFHHNLYNKIGEQLFPFENAFDPHASNNITINSSNINTFKEITKTNFNYDAPQPLILDTKKTDYMFAVKNNVNNYLGFEIKQEGVTDNYIPCIILKKFDHAKMYNFDKYKTKIYDAVPTIFKIIYNLTNSAIIDYKYCPLSNKIGNSVEFYIDSILNNNLKYTYIKYSSKSFTNIPILKEYIKRLIAIYNNSLNVKTDFDNLLIEKDNEFDSNPNPSKIIIHFIVGYLYYCNDKIGFFNPKEIIKEIIEILFDLKKAGDWGQALFCSEYNKKENINKKDCFFVTGDKLAAVRSLLCTNVKTILPVDYKILSGVNTTKKRSIITLYRNRFDLTFKRFVNYIQTSIFTLKAFKLFSIDDLKMEFFMKFTYINSPTVPPGKPNKHDEIITDDNFNYDTFNIFINYLKYQMQIYLYIYTITSLNNDDKTILSTEIKEINHDEYIKEENIASAKIDEINLDDGINIDNIAYQNIQDHDTLDISAFNMFYLLRLKYYSLSYFQNEYLSNVPNVISKQQELFKNIETNLKKFIDKSDIFKKVFELFNKDFDKSVLTLSNTINDCQQKLINICDIYYSYSLLLCDDKFINNNYSSDVIKAIKDEPSQTAIKRIINANNDEITKFFYTFSSFHLDKTKFKIIAKDFITTNIANLTIEKDELEEIKSQLDNLKKYLDVNSPDNDKNGTNLIIYFKSSIYGETPENTAFKIYIDNCIKEYWQKNPSQNFTLPNPVQKLTPDEEALKEHYEDYVNGNYDELWIDLYDYFKIIYAQLFKGFDDSKIITDANKQEITNILSDLYANESIKEINAHTKALTFTYKSTYDTIERRLVKIREAISTNHAEINAITRDAAIIAAAAAAAAAADAAADATADDAAIAAAAAAASDAAAAATAATAATAAAAAAAASSGKKRKKDAQQSQNRNPKRHQIVLLNWDTASKDDKDKVKNNIITLFNKLRGGKKNFEYSVDKFKDIINNTMPYASFLKQPVKESHNRVVRTSDEILAEIGFIIYIIELFEKIILNRTPDIFKNINKYFSDVNSELINHIYKFRYSYYFDTDYVIIPIIYKYLKFIVKNKESFIFAKDESLFTYNKIYEQQYKNRIDHILYNIDVLFNIIKDTPITPKEKESFLTAKQHAPPAPSRGLPNNSRGRGRGRSRGRGRGNSSGLANSSGLGRGGISISRGSSRGSSRGRGNSRGRGRGGGRLHGDYSSYSNDYLDDSPNDSQSTFTNHDSSGDGYMIQLLKKMNLH